MTLRKFGSSAPRTLLVIHTRYRDALDSALLEPFTFPLREALGVYSLLLPSPPHCRCPFYRRRKEGGPLSVFDGGGDSKGILFLRHACFRCCWPDLCGRSNLVASSSCTLIVSVGQAGRNAGTRFSSLLVDAVCRPLNARYTCP